jgi:hypothetical protein
MTPRVTVYISPDHDLYHTSLLLTGLCALEGSDAITLTYREPRGDDRWLTADAIVVCLDIAGDRACRIAIDLRDGEGVSRPILDYVDRYLKRAFFPPELDLLPADLADKIGPYGLNFGMRTPRSTRRLLAAIGWSLARRGRAGVSKLRQFLWTPGPAAFEQGPDTPVEAKVAFQTRLWTSGDVPPDEVEPLNTGRVAMVRALKRAFGDRFVGGLMATPLALAQYPDDVTPHSSKYVDYLAQKKRCLISVYTRGVEHSLAFKLGETLAASQCLVSVPLRYSLPSPLVAGTHYLPFETPDECVAACEALLTSPERARAMRYANREYYASEVAPAAHVGKIIASSQAAMRASRVLQGGGR